MWFKTTGDEVGAPPERRGELLPENFQAYRRRFAAETTFDFDDMSEKVDTLRNPRPGGPAGGKDARVRGEERHLLHQTTAASKARRSRTPWNSSPPK